MKIAKSIRFIILITGFLTIISCKEEPKNTEKKPVQNTKPRVVVPAFNADSAFNYVKTQVDFGPRVPNSDAHKACGNYYVKSFTDMGLKVYEQKFTATAYDGNILSSKNVIAAINPKAQKRILLAAHWDSRPFADQDEENQKQPIDGANDGASGVGILMEIARTIQQSTIKPTVGIDIILFDAEDYGEPTFYKGDHKAESWCLGSQYWAKNKHIENYHAFYGILLDMVGSKDATFYQEQGSLYFAKSVVNKVWAKGNSLGYNKHFINQECSAITDDHYFVNTLTSIPMIDIIHYNHGNERQFFGNYWHTHDDNISVIDKETLKAVGHTLLEVLYDEGS